MGLIDIEKAVGMILESDLKGPSGHQLLSEGVVLTETLIKNLTRYGITAVPVQQREREESSFREGEIREAEDQCREEVMKRFRESSFDHHMNLRVETAVRIEALERLKWDKKD